MLGWLFAWLPVTARDESAVTLVRQGDGTFIEQQYFAILDGLIELALILVKVFGHTHKLMNFKKNKTLNSSSHANPIRISPLMHTSKENKDIKGYQMFQNFYTIPTQMKSMSVSTSSNNQLVTSNRPPLLL
jgi:hypothetical protein